MKARDWLLSCALALSFVPTLASADEPSLAVRTQQRVEAGLLKPLAEHEKTRSRFSRARMPPSERRARVPDATAISDGAGRKFVSFAVDVRFGGNWVENDIVGCVYPQSGDIFVKRGDTYRPADFLLGKAADPVVGVCVAPART